MTTKSFRRPALFGTLLPSILLLTPFIGVAATRSLSPTPVASRPHLPHLVLVVADDLGFSDLGSYGGEMITPNLDRLAHTGMRFTHFYVTPRCSPTRAALLTGRHPHEVGVAHLNLPWQAPAYTGELSPDIPTLAEVLAAAGYRCYMAGKWHLAHNPAEGEQHQEAWPTRRGFHRFFGTIRGSGSYWDPDSLVEDGRSVEPGNAFYYTDAIADAASRFVDGHFRDAPAGVPFFLYLAFTAPHWPLQARADELAEGDDPWTRGWDRLRRERFDRQRATGLADGGWTLSRRPAAVPAWENVPHPAWQARRMAVYAAMVEALDRGVGRVIRTLERHGVLDDTLLLVLSDNGASAEEFRGIGRLARFLMPLPSEPSLRFGDRPGVMPGPKDTFQAYGAGWASLSNSPFRGFKHQTYEGGIASPLIVHWPGRVPAGGIDRTPTHVVDVLPTLLDATGAIYPPPAFPTARTSQLAGRSLLPRRNASVTAAERPLFWEHEGNRAVRLGRYKLVSRWPRGWELYDLGRDRGELHDLAPVQPGRVAQLADLHDAWARRVGVRPWPWVVPTVRRLTLVAATAAAFALLLAAWLARRRWQRLAGGR